MSNFITTLLMLNFSFEKWSFCICFDLAPLIWNLGVSYEGPDDDAMVPGHVVTFSIPTFRIEFRVAQNAKMDEVADKLQKAGLLDLEESPS